MKPATQTPEKTPVRLLELRPVGMFSNVLEVVERIRIANEQGYAFRISWKNSLYAPEGYQSDPWSFFFQQPYGALARKPISSDTAFASAKSVVCSTISCVIPCRENGNCDTAMFPKDPWVANRIIEHYIRLNPNLVRRVAAVRKALFGGSEFIGLHLRGARGVDGGNRRLRALADATGPVPYSIYFRAVDAAIERYPSLPILTCSDSSDVVDQVRKRYGERIITTNAIRTAQGEMHHAVGQNPQLKAAALDLGYDVVVEAYLLSQSKVLIHGFSNVTRFARLKSPDMQADFVYDRLDVPKDWYQT